MGWIVDAFSPDDLITWAVERTGYENFGADDWREGFERLVAALNENSFLTEAVPVIEAMLMDALTSRLRIEAWCREHPEALDRPIEQPLIIMGLPRTASTALQNNLATDEHWRFLRGWEAAQPVPPPVPGQEHLDARFLKEKAYIEQDTTFLGKHIQLVGGPVEDTALQRLNFRGQEMGLPAPAYTSWWRNASMAATFGYQARAMQLLQSQHELKTWMIKSPWYSFHLEDLHHVFPDASMVMTHRRPSRILPSVASLHYTRFQTFLPESAIDKKQIGRFALDHWTIGIARVMEYRRRHGDGRFFDIHHEAFNADPVGVLKRLYDWLDVEMSQDTQRTFAEWAANNRRGTYGSHDYTAEEFGLSEGEIEERFADYIKTYDLRG